MLAALCFLAFVEVYLFGNAIDALDVVLRLEICLLQLQFHESTGECNHTDVVTRVGFHSHYQRKALIRNQVTALLFNGKIVTTEAKAKEIRKVADGLIALAVKEKDNFENVTVTVKVARKDKDGKRVKEVVDGKKKTVYDSIEKTIKKDLPSRVHARREMMKVLYTVTDVPTDNSGKKRNTKTVDVANKLFDEIAPKYAGRNGGYTRIVKIGQRKGDAAMEVLLELV